MELVFTSRYARFNAFRIRSIAAGAALLYCLVTGPTWANGTFDVQSDGDLISVSADNASLVAITDRVSELTGIPITYTEGRDQAVSLEIVDEKLEYVIEKLAKNSLIVRKTVNGEEIISEVVVLLEGDGGDAGNASLPTGEPAEEVITGEEPTAESIEGTGEAGQPEEPMIVDDGSQQEPEIVDDGLQQETEPVDDGTQPVGTQ